MDIFIKLYQSRMILAYSHLGIYVYNTMKALFNLSYSFTYRKNIQKQNIKTETIKTKQIYIIFKTYTFKSTKISNE